MGTTAYGGKGSKGRAANGDRPVGAASCRREQHTMTSWQIPLPNCGEVTPQADILVTPQADILGPAVEEGSPTTGMGCSLGRTWPTARLVALLCLDPT